jgi:ABC-type phosphate transport system substrate-binding protein
VRNRAGAFVRADLQGVTAAAEAALVGIPDDLRFSLTDAPGRESYPISGTVWAVLYVNQPSPKGRPLVDFLRWATHEGQRYATDLHYVPLPAGLVERIDRRLAHVQLAPSGGTP